MLVRKAYNLAKVMKSQYEPRSRLTKLQDKKISFLVKFAYKNIKFYRDKYDKNNVDVSKIKTKNDLKRLPIITKQDLQCHANNIINRKDSKYLQNMRYKRGVIRRTGGSTGNPLFVYYDNGSWDYSEAIYARSLFGTGYKPYNKLILSNPFLKPEKRWFEYLGLIRKKYISINMNMKTQLDLLLQEKSDYTFYSYPTILRILSGRLGSYQPNMQRIISTAELLTEKTRKLIESKFNCPVYNHYGSMECNRIAWECTKKEGLHMDIDSNCIEFIRNKEQVAFEERGKIIITNLHNYAFPLIRYDQGDIGVPILDKCSCGRSLPMIKELLGRDNDFIVLKNKEVISPIILDVALSSFSEILQFRLIQKTLNNFNLFIIEGNGFDDKTKERIEHNIKQILKNTNININFKSVEKFTRSPGGKLRSIVSNLR